MVICVDPSVPVIVPTSPVTPSTVGVSDSVVMGGQAVRQSPEQALVPESLTSLRK